MPDPKETVLRKGSGNLSFIALLAVGLSVGFASVYLRERNRDVPEQAHHDDHEHHEDHSYGNYEIAPEDSLDATNFDAFKTECLLCHAVPDLTVPSDRAWYEQVAQSACSNIPDRAGKPLQEYFASIQDQIPTWIKADDPITPDMAKVTCNIDDGEIFLRDTKMKTYRLRWSPENAGSPRGLPADTYLLVGYRIFKKNWMIQTSHHQNIDEGRGNLVFPAGKTTGLQLQTYVRSTMLTRWRPRGLWIETLTRGHKGMGLTIYKDGKQIPIVYRVLDKEGEVLAKETMEYG